MSPMHRIRLTIGRVHRVRIVAQLLIVWVETGQHGVCHMP